MSDDDVQWSFLRKAAEAYCRGVSRLSAADFVARVRNTGWPLDKKREGKLKRAFQHDPCYAFYTLSTHQIDVDDIAERDPEEMVSESWRVLREVSEGKLPVRKPQVIINDQIVLRVAGVERTADGVVNIPGEIVDLANELLEGKAEDRICVLPPYEPSLPIVFVHPDVWKRALKAKLIPDIEIYILRDPDGDGEEDD